jgi:terminase large subunit-like protein
MMSAHDQTAIVAVTFDKSRQQARLVDHRIYQPTSDQPLDFELTIETYLLDLTQRFAVRQILFDPWQMQATAQRLRKAGLPLQEFPQSSPNLTAASQCLFDLIESQSIVLYPDAEMRLAVSRCVAIETPRGWRIGKDKSSFKIDVVVALAMACHAAVQGAGQYYYDKDYKGWQAEADLPQQPAAQQPEPAGPLWSGNWWQYRPQQPPQTTSADVRLLQLYGGLENALRYGLIR